MKNKTLVILILLCNLLAPSSFAGEISKSCNCMNCRNKTFIKKYHNIEYIKCDDSGVGYALGTLRMLSDRLSELMFFLEKMKSNKELSSNQVESYSKDIKLLTYSCYDSGIRTRPYGREFSQQYFKGLDNFMFHPMYMLINPGSGLNFSWLTCYPSSRFSDMLNIFVRNIKRYKYLRYYDSRHLCISHLKKMSRLKLSQALEIEEFYTKYSVNSYCAMVMFENIIALFRQFGLPKDLAVKHLEFFVKYAKTQKNSEALLKRTREILSDNARCFSSSVEDLLYLSLRIK